MEFNVWQSTCESVGFLDLLLENTGPENSPLQDIRKVFFRRMYRLEIWLAALTLRLGRGRKILCKTRRRYQKWESRDNTGRVRWIKVQATFWQFLRPVISKTTFQTSHFGPKDGTSALAWRAARSAKDRTTNTNLVFTGVRIHQIKIFSFYCSEVVKGTRGWCSRQATEDDHIYSGPQLVYAITCMVQSNILSFTILPARASAP